MVIGFGRGGIVIRIASTTLVIGRLNPSGDTPVIPVKLQTTGVRTTKLILKKMGTLRKNVVRASVVTACPLFNP